MTTRREFFYELDDRGVLTLNGYIQDDPWFLDFVFRRMAPSADPMYPEYAWVCRCGDEMNYIRPVDTAIVFQHFDGERLWYAPGLSVPFQADKLGVSADGVLYHDAPIGGRGRLVPEVAMAIGQRIVPWGPYYAYLESESPARLVPIVPADVPDTVRVMRPRADNLCVGCGTANDDSLALTFLYDAADGVVTTYITPDSRMHGAMNTVHGGWVSLLMDEVMGKGLSARGLKAPTAQLNVRFRKPMLMHREHMLRSFMVRQEGRKNYMHAEIRATDSPDDVVAEAEALFLTVHQRT